MVFPTQTDEGLLIHDVIQKSKYYHMQEIQRQVNSRLIPGKMYIHPADTTAATTESVM